MEDMETMDHLGKGAFGTVYKVRHKPSGRIMALKTMSKELIQKTGKNEHIKNEKRILQIAATYAKSPYLIKLHYSFHDENLLYLAMEYCPGGDLLKLIENIGYFSENQAKLYFAEMIMAVHSLHSLGFLHRDLKPVFFLK
uniref:non-specific serine/threonine protein kinase n=1 Tax=Arcella intermedia TaxID=1963864 RepID=A0A6B2LPF6_9EUKA